MKYNKFILIAESTNGKLTDDVNNYLKDGWELYGFTSIHDGIFFQALVKYDYNSNSNITEEKQHGKHIRK